LQYTSVRDLQPTQKGNMKNHEKALLKILRYLRGTPKGGLIITPRKA
jgi:hypothetical protein